MVTSDAASSRGHSFAWVEFRVRPKKDGLHDSGYRYLEVVGVPDRRNPTRKVPISEWADHIWVRGEGANIDAEPDGTQRIACLDGSVKWDGFSGSSVILEAKRHA